MGVYESHHGQGNVEVGWARTSFACTVAQRRRLRLEASGTSDVATGKSLPERRRRTTRAAMLDVGAQDMIKRAPTNVTKPPVEPYLNLAL